MTEMIERVAKAIYELDRERRKLKRSWDDLPDLPKWDNREQWREMARAAIEAMRCPPKRVLDFGYASLARGEAMFDVWNAMIDAALGETT